MDVLEWARANGCPLWSKTPAIPKTMDKAAKGGHMEALRWLRRHGFGWGPDTCAAAATGHRGQIDILVVRSNERCQVDSPVTSPSLLPCHAMRCGD